MSESSARQASVKAIDSPAPRPLKRLQALAPYKQGKSQLPGRDRVIKLSSNEGCFGPSPKAMEAYRALAPELHRYPDGTQTQLREAIAGVHGIDADRIVCGNGSEELIGLLIRCFLGEGDELLLSENNFMMCSIYGKSQAAKIVLAPERDFQVDVDALLKCITPRTRVLSVANPNNPTGTYLPSAEIERLVAEVPPHVLIILDGAYVEYVTREDYDDGLRWAEKLPNVVVTRSFSKMYGLAGLRIGWAYGPADVIEVVNRLRTPFNANAAALAAAAAAVTDYEHVEHTRRHVAAWQERIASALGDRGVTVVPSVTNFYLVDFEPRADKTAKEAAAVMEANGIIPRPGSADRFLRITVGTDEENEALLEVLGGYLDA
ncbi:histidinol-phosphate transaminase [Elongatibacter sediminis]|uniref:Histidinol-phosphate aminotransferase n=1 Tax=Elongatibacter sediminis TaxID=3119006 RepID=A0AAW9R4R1_9GAMM